METFYCTTDEQWARVAKLFIETFTEMTPHFSVATALEQFIHYCATHEAIGVTLHGQTIAYVIYKVDGPTAHVAAALGAKDYRFSKFLYYGWRALGEQLERASEPVTTVQFQALRTNETVNALYRQFTVETSQDELYYYYNASLAQFMAPIRRLQQIEARRLARQKGEL